MEITKTFVTLDNIATITCPQCRKSRNIDTSKYRNRRHTIKVKCSCRYNFSVLLDFRRQYRKEANLEGTFSLIPPAIGHGKLIVLNISRSGVGFSAGTSDLGLQQFVPGGKVKIKFQLDNRKRTEIEKIVVIKNVNGHYVGGEFEQDSAFEKELGFYLQP